MRDQEAAENLDRLRDEVARLQQQLAAARNQLQRVVIESPIPGFAVNSVVFTTGGVIAPGQVIMEIIPTDEALIIDVKVDPKDRNAVREGRTPDSLQRLRPTHDPPDQGARLRSFPPIACSIQ